MQNILEHNKDLTTTEVTMKMPDKSCRRSLSQPRVVCSRCGILLKIELLVYAMITCLLSRLEVGSGSQTMPMTEVLDLIREKARCHRLWVARHHGLEGLSARQSYNQARNQVRKRTRQHRKQYELNIANQSTSNPKVFWRLARDRLKTKIGVAPLLCNPDDPGTLRHSDEKKTDTLQSQFCSVFTREPEGEIPQLEPRIGERLERLVITHEWVLKALIKTNITRFCGPHELHPRMLKELAVELAAPMTTLFNQSLFLGEVPEEWKMYLQPSRRGVERWQRTTVLSLSPQLVARLWRPLSERESSHI